MLIYDINDDDRIILKERELRVEERGSIMNKVVYFIFKTWKRYYEGLTFYEVGCFFLEADEDAHF